MTCKGKSFTYRKEFSIFIKCILKFYYVNFKAIGCILKLLPLQGVALYVIKTQCVVLG